MTLGVGTVPEPGGGGGGSFGIFAGGIEVVAAGVVGAGTGGIAVVAGPVCLTPCWGTSGLNPGSELNSESARSAYPRAWNGSVLQATIPPA